MRTLLQLEPRFPIPATGPFPYVINVPGSYYLTGNVSVASGDAIVVQANDVTLDLNGFTIASTSPTLSGKAIVLDGSFRTNVSISNGFIRGTSIYAAGSNTVTGGGFAEAIGGGNAFGGPEGSAGPTAIRVSGLGISGLGEGIRLNPDSPSNIVERTAVAIVQGAGIRAGSVADSTADRTGGVSIEARSVSNVAGSRYTAGTIILPAPTTPLVRADLDTRIPIPAGTATFTISAPGSYILMGNLTVATGNGITITADDVTLDLNGFTIASNAANATGDAISLSGSRARIAISNGHIRSGTRYESSAFTNGPGFASGINWPSSSPVGVRVTGVSITGVTSFGIDVGTDSSSIVQGCTVRVVGGLGIRAGVVSDSSVTVGGATTISAGRIANSVGARADNSGTGLVTTGPTLEAIAASATAAQSAATGAQTAANGAQSSSASVQTTANAIQTTVNATSSAVNNSLVTSRDRRTPVELAGSVLGPGSFYLTRDLTVASGTCLTIAGPDTTLDLNGFTISSTSATHSGSGIQILSGARNVKIVNGQITGTTTVAGGVYSGGGFASGISDPSSGSSASVIVRDVQVTGVDQGIDLNGSFSVVEGCVVRTCAEGGVSASIVRATVVRDALNFGIAGGSVVGCVVSGVGGFGINATTVDACVSSGGGGITGQVVSNSSGSGTDGNGIFADVVLNSRGSSGGSAAGLGGTRAVMNSYGTSVTGDGLTSDAGVVTNSYGGASGGTGVGLRAFTANGSRGLKNGAASQVITNKYNMP